MVRSWLLASSSLLLVTVAWGAELRVEVLKESAPTAELSAQVAGTLAPTGIRVIRDSGALCDIWLCKELTAVADFTSTSEVSYPFQTGQLIGVARFSKKSSDFRDQDIVPGVYTLRYAQQPVDGAHVGTSPTRDFLLLSQAKKDQSPAIAEYKPLAKQSAEAAGSSHPALLSLQKPAAETTELPAIRHNEEKDWWIVALQAPVKSGGAAAKPLVCELVIVGMASE